MSNYAQKELRVNCYVLQVRKRGFCGLFLAFLLTSVAYGAQFAGQFKSEKDRLIFEMVDASNDAFNMKKPFFTEQIKHDRWNDTIAQIDKFVKNNAQDLLRRPDEHILRVYNDIIKDNNQILKILYTVYNDYIAAKDQSLAKKREGFAEVYRLNTIARNLNRLSGDSDLLELLMGKITLQRKIDTIHLMFDLVEILSAVCNKAVVDYAKIAQHE